MNGLNEFLYGASATAALAIGLFFLRFWKETADRLFLMFALAMWGLGSNYVMLAVFTITDETRPYIYLLRLAAFLLIIVAIIDKNRSKLNRSSQ